MIFTVLGAGGVRLVIQPYFQNTFYESLMNQQNEAAQIARSIYLFKCPQHPQSAHFQALSKDYKLYAKIKRHKLQVGTISSPLI
jgi:hypothetical protein